MNTPEWIKPAIWGGIGGAVVAMTLGFSWAGWVTQGTAGQMEEASAKAAIIQAFTPLCVAKAEPQKQMLAKLKEESQWKHDDFVVEAGWVDNVNENYRADVARRCAATLIEGMNTD